MSPEPASAQVAASSPPGSARRRVLLLCLKIAVAAGLVWLLLRSGSLDLAALTMLWRSPLLFAANLGTWLVCALALSTLRWQLLLRLADVRLPLLRAAGLQLMALFLNVAVPGNVSGDVVKSLVVAREHEGTRRPAILLVLLVERLLGLFGLVSAGAIATLLGGPSLWQAPAVHSTVSATFLLAALCGLGATTGVFLLRRHGHVLRRVTQGSSPVAVLADRLLSAAQMVVSRPAILALGLGISIAMHAVSMAYFGVVTWVVTGQPASYGVIATVFPMGLLTVVLPVSPAGIGVGHVAFEQLYRLVGLRGGATVFNVFLVGQIAPCVVGAIPTMLLRARPSAPKSDTSTQAVRG